MMRGLNNKVLLFSIVIGLCTSCTSHTTSYVDKQKSVLPNGKQILVEKTNIKTSQYGIITNHNYGDHYSYTYNFTIKEGTIHWDGGSREPKELLFTPDTVYLKSLTIGKFYDEVKDTIQNTSKRVSRNEVQEVFEKFVDKRYFFKWFGDAYWVTIPKSRYSIQQQKGESYEVPNDKELILK